MVRRLSFLALALAPLTVACGDTSGTTTPKGSGAAGSPAIGGTDGTTTTKDADSAVGGSDGTTTPKGADSAIGGTDGTTTPKGASSAIGGSDGTTTPKGAGSGGSSASGGMGSGTRIVVAVDPPKLTGSFRAAGQSVNPLKLKIDVSLSQSITQRVYLRIIEGQSILLASAPVDQPQPNSNGGYEAWVNLDPDLAVGTYQGTLRFELCKDVSCQAYYNLSGNEIPYLVEVHPAVAFTIAEGESPPGGPLLERAVLGPVRTGTTVRVEASEQVVYSPSSDCARADSVTQDGTSWKGTLFNGQGSSSSSCIFYLKLISVALPLAQANCDFMVTN